MGLFRVDFFILWELLELIQILISCILVVVLFFFLTRCRGDFLGVTVRRKAHKTGVSIITMVSSCFFSFFFDVLCALLVTDSLTASTFSLFGRGEAFILVRQPRGNKVESSTSGYVFWANLNSGKDDLSDSEDIFGLRLEIQPTRFVFSFHFEVTQIEKRKCGCHGSRRVFRRWMQYVVE